MARVAVASSRRLVDVHAVMELLGVCDQTVYRMARRGAFAYFRDPLTRSWRFPLDSVEAFVAANTTPARPHREDVSGGHRSARKPRARRAATPAQRAEDTPPWEGFSQAPTRRAAGGGGTRTNGAASSAATHRSTRPRDS